MPTFNIYLGILIVYPIYRFCHGFIQRVKQR